MTDPSQSRKKRKMTIIASLQGVERAEKALIRLGFESKFNFAKTRFLSRSVITKFFQCLPIQLDSFKKICKELKLDWREIAGITEEEQSERLEINDCNSLDIYEEVEVVQTLRRQVTVIDQQSQTIKVEILLKGDINSVHSLKILQLILKEYSGDTIEITDIKEGSIILIVKGSEEDIERLISQFKSGELTKVSSYPVENIQILSESSDDDENNELDDKWRLVQEIVSQPTKGRNLSGADLSDADLSDADLSGADLSGADLSGADLSDADLSDANLNGADLSGADLKNTDLRNADLGGADLRNADLDGANLSGTNLSSTNLSGAKISEETKIDGKWRLVWEISTQGARGRNLSRANLRDANLRDANLSGTYLSDADLRNADLDGAVLRRVHLSGADLEGANLESANLESAYLSSADLSSANLSNANLSGADLRDADLSGADLRDANLRDANLSHANLSGANINQETQISGKWRLVWKIVNQGAFSRDLNNADLGDAYLKDANLSGANLSGAYLRDADLRGADLSGAYLSGANLSGADLSGAYLSGANLSGAYLSGAYLSGANLSGAIVANALFGGSRGLTEEMKRDLEQRGAIFGDRPPVLIPR